MIIENLTLEGLLFFAILERDCLEDDKKGFISSFSGPPRHYLIKHISPIPDICHFFTLAKFLENKIYTEKTPIFRVKSVKKRHFFA